METSFTPIQWTRDTWGATRFELLSPLWAGIALTQLTVAVVVLQSYRTPLWILCLGAAVYAAWRSFAFLYWLYVEHEDGAAPLLDANALYRTFLPQIASMALYVLMAPTDRLGIFFAAMSLPNILFLCYLAGAFARITLWEGRPRLPVFVLPKISIQKLVLPAEQKNA